VTDALASRSSLREPASSFLAARPGPDDSHENLSGKDRTDTTRNQSKPLPVSDLSFLSESELQPGLFVSKRMARNVT
jgi:hypothetical protein